MQHLALNVDDDAQLIAMRDRIRSRGVNVIGPIDHGFCKSIYFAGPEHLTLEISTSRAAIDPAQPHMRYPDAAYRKLIEMPDDVMTATRSETTPPVQR